jgi:hypothetical protein
MPSSGSATDPGCESAAFHLGVRVFAWLAGVPLGSGLVAWDDESDLRRWKTALTAGCFSIE